MHIVRESHVSRWFGKLWRSLYLFFKARCSVIQTATSNDTIDNNSAIFVDLVQAKWTNANYFRINWTYFLALVWLSSGWRKFLESLRKWLAAKSRKPDALRLRTALNTSLRNIRFSQKCWPTDWLFWGPCKPKPWLSSTVTMAQFSRWRFKDWMMR